MKLKTLFHIVSMFTNYSNIAILFAKPKRESTDFFTISLILTIYNITEIVQKHNEIKNISNPTVLSKSESVKIY